MKTKRIISIMVSMMILLSGLVVRAAHTFPPQDSGVWTSLTDKQADNLLTKKNESFIFVFYRDNCPNSQRSIPAILEYADENNISLCGINANEFPAWMTWSKFGYNTIGFPYIIVYNAQADLLASKDNVFTVKQFEDLLAEVTMSAGSSAAPSGGYNQLFTDVEKSSSYYVAISQLAKDGVITGYEDGTFKPDNSISRTEAAVIIVRAGGLSTQGSKKSTYSDVANDFWGKDYIMAASEAGIIKGMGDGIFAPQNNVTRTQIIKMIVCMAGLEQSAIDNGGWPYGYMKTAFDKSIIDANTYMNLYSGSYGDEAATRGEVAQWIYKSRGVQNKDAFVVNGKAYKLGMSASVLGLPDESMNSTHTFKWHVYGTDDYKNFFAAGVYNDKIVALASTGVGFEYKGYRAGQTLKNSSENASGEFLLDSNDGNIIHGVFLIDNEFKNVPMYNLAGFGAESKMNFHFTNGFRVYHKMKPYEWDEKAAEAARLHSTDMATNSYFNHTGLDGSNMGDRMRAQGVYWTTCAENIHAGSSLGINAYNSWVNSSGHRKNILGSCTHLGVGFAYNESDVYKFYSTQNFYAYESGFSTFFN